MNNNYQSSERPLYRKYMVKGSQRCDPGAKASLTLRLNSSSRLLELSRDDPGWTWDPGTLAETRWSRSRSTKSRILRESSWISPWPSFVSVSWYETCEWWDRGVPTEEAGELVLEAVRFLMFGIRIFEARMLLISWVSMITRFKWNN